MNEIFANFANLINAYIASLRIQERGSDRKKMRLLTDSLAVCSCQIFLEVGGAIAFQTSTYELDKNLAH